MPTTKRKPSRAAVIARTRAERAESLRLRGLCSACEHESHDGSCAQSTEFGQHWVTCGCAGS